MDEVKERLEKTGAECLKAYEAWCGNKKDREAREAIHEAVHELRKVASRIEIELAVSERNEMTQRPIPIPPHRDANRRVDNDDDGGGDTGSRRKRRAPRRKNHGGQRSQGQGG